MLSNVLFHLDDSIKNISYMGLGEAERESFQMKLNQAYKLVEEVYSKVKMEEMEVADTDSHIIRSSN